MNIADESGHPPINCPSLTYIPANDRPDYSPTTDDSDEDEQHEAERKFFLRSDLSKNDPADVRPASSAKPNTNTKPSRLYTLDRATYKGAHADESTYTRCFRCLDAHGKCNRQLPFCQRCTNPNECVYFEKAKYKNQDQAVELYKAAESDRRQVSKSVTRSKGPTKAEKPSPKLSNALKPISWLDGDISNSQKQCPASILRQINKHLAEFESSVAASIWPGNKSTFLDLGREVFFVDDLTKKEVPVARYSYGPSSQFFVAWLLGSNLYNFLGDDVLEPTIIKFRVYMNTQLEVMKGKHFKCVNWETWVPIGSKHLPQQVLRYIEDKKRNHKAHAYSSAEVTPHQVEQQTSSTNDNSNQKRTREQSDAWATPQNGLEDDQTSKRTRIHSEKKASSSTTSNLKANGAVPFQTNTRSSLRTSLPQADTAKPPRSLVKEPLSDGPEVSCVFQDGNGGPAGTFTYHECDTAQKLFDVACVAGIAQIEPPATRLLKVQFEGGGGGRVRPDNDNDYHNVFQKELDKLTKGGKDKGPFTVYVSPYL